MRVKRYRKRSYFSSIYVKNKIEATVYIDPIVEIYSIDEKEHTEKADIEKAKYMILKGNLKDFSNDLSFISSSDFYKISPDLCQSFPQLKYFIDNKLNGIFSDLKLLQKYVSHLTRLRSAEFKFLNYEPEYLFYGNILKFIKSVRKEAYKRDLNLISKFATLIGNSASLDKDIYEIMQYTDFVQHPSWFKYKADLDKDFIKEQTIKFENKVNEVVEIFLEVVEEKLNAFFKL